MLGIKRFCKLFCYANLIIVFLCDLLWAGDANRGFDLKWESVPDAAAYQIDISINPNMNPLLFTQQTKDTTYIWQAPDMGTYYWRVRAINGLGAPQTSSEIGTLHATVSSPKILNLDEKILRALEEKDSSVDITLKWNPHPSVNEYQVETSSDTSFRTRKTYFVKNQTHITVVSKENIYWRVVALNNTKGVVSDYSDIGNIVIEDEIPLPKGFKGLNFTAGAHVWKMDAIDIGTLERAQFISTRAFSFNATGRYQLYDRTGLRLRLGMTNLSVQSPLGKRLRSTSYTNLDYGFDINQRFSKNFSVLFSVDYEQDLYSRAITLNTLTFDSVSIFKLGLGVNRELTTYKSWKISGNVSTRYLAGARAPGYNIGGGLAFGVGLKMTQKFSQYDAGVGLSYYHEAQNTAIARQWQSFIGLNLIFNWDSIEKSEK